MRKRALIPLLALLMLTWLASPASATAANGAWQITDAFPTAAQITNPDLRQVVDNFHFYCNSHVVTLVDDHVVPPEPTVAILQFEICVVHNDNPVVNPWGVTATAYVWYGPGYTTSTVNLGVNALVQSYPKNAGVGYMMTWGTCVSGSGGMPSPGSTHVMWSCASTSFGDALNNDYQVGRVQVSYQLTYKNGGGTFSQSRVITPTYDTIGVR